MPFLTVHDVQRGIARLMTAPRDLPPTAPYPDPPVPLAQASSGHQELFAKYTELLEQALTLAEDWWAQLIKVRRDQGLDADDALEAVYSRRAAGPASRPEVVWTIRTHWLACIELNATLPEAQRIPPEVLLLHWLRDGKHDEWVQVLTGMPHWPIGLDADGNWV
jgi:hypothetical protein